MMRQAARPLVVVHYHWRAGGVRRVVETALPDLVRSGRFDSVVLVSGEAADGPWLDALREAMKPVPLVAEVLHGFAYRGELKCAASREALQRSLDRLLSRAGHDPVIWAHNLALGRHAAVSAAVGDAAANRGAVLLSHHHDFLFDNRWGHWAGVVADGFDDLRAAAGIFFPSHPRTVHIAINRRDHDLLARGFGPRAVYLPNPVAGPEVTEAERSAARRWMKSRGLVDGGSCWLMPCRLMRRKNIAEAVLLARWLGEDADVVTTGGPSSAEEESYASALAAAAKRGRWPLRLAVLAGSGDGPSVPALMAAAAAVVSTSLHEGFGLTVHEAALLRRPVFARATADLAVSVPAGTNVYDDLIVPDDLFDRRRERKRQESIWNEWTRALPAEASSRARLPSFFDDSNGSVAFSRLTFQAQTEVLSHPASDLHSALAASNPVLARCRGNYSVPSEETGEQPEIHRAANFVRLFLAALQRADEEDRPDADAAARVVEGFLAERVGGSRFYPLLAGSRF